MNKQEKKNVFEGLKDFSRVVILSVVSYLLTEGVIQKIVIWFAGTRLDATQVMVITGLITSALKGLDKWMYKEDKTIIPVSGATGLTGI